MTKDITEIEFFKKKAFAWAANAFGVFCGFDNHRYRDGLVTPAFDCLLACGVVDALELTTEKGAFEALKKFRTAHEGAWLMGFLTYDLKNDVENLHSAHVDGLGFPALYFFRPQFLIKITDDSATFLQNNPKNGSDTVTQSVMAQKALKGVLEETFETYFDAICRTELTAFDPKNAPFTLKKRFERAEYEATVAQVQQHIAKGDIFEMNFCQEFYAENVAFSEAQIAALFDRLNSYAQAPFSSFFKLNQHYALCASPERFVKKTGDTLISQPIKGTSRRGKTPEEDVFLQNTLKNDPKNRSENVMIVDLVRNDLGRSCVAGTVAVTELFGIYSFPTVHQMISTVEGQLRPDVHYLDALKGLFPMGSMTGAPKVRAMQLIEQYERSRRGLYSGAIGYFSPDGDFDFNVLIRSILYSKKNNYLSFQVGGAIVADSVPAQEYEECLVKIKGILTALHYDMS